MNIDYYDLFRELRRCKIDPKMINRDYGNHAAFIMNYCCPIVVRKGGRPLDELAEDYGFESSDELYYLILGYKPESYYLNDPPPTRG